MSAYVALIVMIIGLLMYFIPSTGKLNEVGRLTYVVGLLVLLYPYAGKVFHLP